MLAIAALSLAAFAVPDAYTLHAALNVWDVTAHDLNRDGYDDILVLACDEKSSPLDKHLAVFLAQENGAYPQEPSLVLPLAPESGPLFLSETDGTPPADIVIVNAEGARVFRFAGGAFELASTIHFDSLFPSGSKQPVFLRSASMDLDGDGRDEWIVPKPLGVEVRRTETPVAHVACDIVSESSGGSNLYISHRLPALQTFEIDNGNRQGIAFLSDEYADFAYGPTWSDHHRFKIPLNLEEKWEATARMADINKDKWPDLMVTQTRGTVNLEVLTQVYLAGGAFAYPEKPSATFQAQGSIANGFLADVDGDELLDMIFIRVPFGIRNIMNFMLRGMVHIEADVYLFKDGKFSDKPQFQEGLTIGAPEGREEVAHTLADFNGDGRLDLALATSRDELSLFTGRTDRFISKKAWQVVNVPSFGTAQPHDLNENGAQDLLIFHTSGEHRKRVEVLVF